MKAIYRRIIMVIFAGTLALTMSSCAVVGRQFSANAVKQIQIGKTTRDDVLHLFGRPWRIGMEDGMKTWTYGHYRYSIIKEPSTSDLIIRFDEKEIVASYSFSTTDY